VAATASIRHHLIPQSGSDNGHGRRPALRLRVAMSEPAPIRQTLLNEHEIQQDTTIRLVFLFPSVRVTLSTPVSRQVHIQPNCVVALNGLCVRVPM
jgi:hypothetical protein